MQNGNHQPSEYRAGGNSKGCRIVFGILLLIVAAVFAFVGVFVIRLANSTIGSGSGGFIVIITFLLSGLSAVLGLTALVARKE